MVVNTEDNQHILPSTSIKGKMSCFPGNKDIAMNPFLALSHAAYKCKSMSQIHALCYAIMPWQGDNVNWQSSNDPTPSQVLFVGATLLRSLPNSKYYSQSLQRTANSINQLDVQCEDWWPAARWLTTAWLTQGGSTNTPEINKQITFYCCDIPTKVFYVDCHCKGRAGNDY